MKKKLVSTVSTGLLVSSLVLGGASFASAKSPEQSHGPSAVQHPAATVPAHGASAVLNTTAPAKSVEKDSAKGKVEIQPKSTTQKSAVKTTSTEKSKVQKSSSKAKKASKKPAVTIKSAVGKTLEKRINSSETAINNIIKSVNAYFGVSSDGTADKTLSKKTANSAYNNFKGKLTAEVNKLHAIDKQIANYKKGKKAPAADLSALAEKSKELQTLAANEIKQAQTLATQASAPQQGDGTATTPTSGTTTDTTGTTTDTTTGSTTDTTTGTTTDTTSGTPTDTTTGTTTDTTSGSTVVSAS